MITITYLTGDATQPVGPGPKILVHACNDRGGWGKGFVVATSKRWKEPEAAYRRWYSQGGADPFELGQVLMVQVADDLWVANLVGQEGMGAKAVKPPVRYEAIAKGLERVAEFAQQNGASVHMPQIGCGLAGGKWEESEPIIERTLLANDIAVTVYDFEPGREDRREPGGAGSAEPHCCERTKSPMRPMAARDSGSPRIWNTWTIPGQTSSFTGIPSARAFVAARMLSSRSISCSPT